MEWMDFSALKADELIEKDWNFRSLTKHLNGRETASLGDTLLLTMQSKELANEEIKTVKNHVNLSGYNPLRGKNKNDLGLRFPDMSHPYEEFAAKDEAILIRAGQDEEHPFNAIEASEIVYQTILAKHQRKKVFALVYGPGVDAKKIINIFRGE
ncbi:MAG: hypothetical protein WCT23_06980 [Candidatus Neomarinimicrobiota bacterium]